ncbi:hypothetical protein F2Q70_00016594 [Brassica cretica]|uniref:Uncharacterized protein n=1 Tax=Brassica cretica TaxID=69181 RepID=A0A8S9HZ35_BRACR|nr:hypothetical protein F2Q70_00016594 [Brassica cretica]
MQTTPLSRLEVVEKIVKFGTATLGNSYQHVLKSGFRNAKSDRAIRVSFKGIPSVFIFGLFYLLQHLAMSIKNTNCERLNPQIL